MTDNLDIKDNFDLANRRNRLRLNQWDIGSMLGVQRGRVSEFETKNRLMPNGIGRKEYEALLDRLEAQRSTAA